MNNLKNLTFCMLIVGSQVEIHTAQESRKRQSEHLEQVPFKKILQAQEDNDPVYQHVNAIANDLSMLDIDKETRQNNLNLMTDLPETIANVEKVIQEDELMETVFIQALWDLMPQQSINPEASLAEHENPMVRHIMKHSFSMRFTIQKWVDKPNSKMHPDSLLCMAAAINHTEMAQMLINTMGADVNVQDACCKKTPLHYAVENHFYNLVKILVTTPGINVHLQDASPDKQPALHKICGFTLYAHKSFIFNIFIQAKANLQSKNKDGNTLLHIIAQLTSNYRPMIKDIISTQPCNLNIQNNEGSTPLHCAASSGNPDLINELLDAKPNLNIQDNKGNTPLHLSNSFLSVCVVKKFFATKEADLNIQNHEGNTPLHEAVLNKAFTLTSQLLAAGADKTIKNNDNKTARELAETPAIIAVFAKFNKA